MIIVMGRIMTPQKCLHIETCDYVTLYGKKDVADVIKDIEVGRLS